MANSGAFCDSFKTELLAGVHALATTVTRATTTPDTLKAALFLATGSLGAATATYDSVVASEVSGTNYTAGGVVVPNATAPAIAGGVAYWTPSAAFSWANVTLSNTFDAVLIYNATQGNRAIGVYTCGPQTVTAGDFAISMPTNDAANALIRVGG